MILSNSDINESNSDPLIKTNNAQSENIKSSKVTGRFLYPFLYVTSYLNIAGRSVKVIKITDNIPIIDIVAIDLRAG